MPSGSTSQSGSLRTRVVASTIAMRIALVIALPLPALAQLPGITDLPDTIDRIKPSIVVVGSYRNADNPRFSMRGTGFAAGNGNLVVTNAHVLGAGVDAAAPPPEASDRAWVVQARDGNGRLQMRRATVLDTDPVHDLALLRIDGAALPTLALQDSTAVREGQAVAFIGFPIGGVLGYSPVTHSGMVSSIAPISLPVASGQQLSPRLIRSLRSGSFDIFQLDGTAYPGNSGGPLFDPASGGVLGVLNMVFVKSTREAVLSQPSGISYAIPSNYVRELLKKHAAQ